MESIAQAHDDVAYVLVVGDGKFAASHVEVDGQWVHATGCWESRSGTRTVRSGRLSRTWPARRVKSIRWTGRRDERAR
jgi:hypothetical protein